MSRYEPTLEQRENLKIKEGQLLLSGDGVFHTIQGEGDTVGLPVTFVRLHHCNLSCSWCDTPYTWNRDSEEFYTEPYQVATTELSNHVIQAQKDKGLEQPCPNIVFSGGEPLIQQAEIVRFANIHPNTRIWIETNGTVMPNEELVVLARQGRVRFNCSPKLSNANMPQYRRIRGDVIKALNELDTIFKFVCSSPEDIIELENDYTHLIDKEKIMIMPEGRTEDENNEHLRVLIEMIMRKGLRITPRLQNSLFDGKRAT